MSIKVLVPDTSDGPEGKSFQSGLAECLHLRVPDGVGEVRRGALDIFFSFAVRVKSAEEGISMTETWRETRAQYEAKSEWRATITRDNKIRFILEGKGAYKGRYYEHAEGQGVYPVQVEPGNLYEQLEAGEIRLVAGSLPLVSKTNQTGSH